MGAAVVVVVVECLLLLFANETAANISALILNETHWANYTTCANYRNIVVVANVFVQMI